MPYLSEEKIAAIVERVLERLQQGESEVALHGAIQQAMQQHTGAGVPQQGRDLGGDGRLQPGHAASGFSGGPAAGAMPSSARSASTGLGRGVFADVDAAVVAAGRAAASYGALGLQARYRIVAEMRSEAHRQVEALSKMAVEETGLGRVQHKVTKNRLVIDKSPGPEILEPWARSGDDGLVLEEWAPYGVIAAITPCTNPSETVICNSIGMVAAGNAVVFNAHPSAKGVSAATVQMLHDSVVRAGGPEGLICCTADPTIEMAQRLMRHPGIRLLVVTGGPGVVKEAMGSGKKVIAAGPGNPPVVVDETADLQQAAVGIVNGIGLDNNIVCTDEKEIIAVAAIADPLKSLLRQHGAHELSPEELARLEKVVVQDGQVNRRWVGKDAAVILREIGVHAPPSTLIAFGEVPEGHPFVQLELLMPVTGLVRAADGREAIAMAVRCEHGNNHSAAIYSKNIETMHSMARAVNTSIFTKNAPTYAGLGLGGEGYSSFTIASPTGEGLTNAQHFSRRRRCTLKEYFRIV